MAMPAAPTEWTVEMLDALPDDGQRYPYDLTDLLLAVEVESPSNPAYDYQTKRAVYLGSGVPEYWIVSSTARTIARWRGRTDPGEIIAERLEWQPDGMPSPFGLVLPEFFEDALG